MIVDPIDSKDVVSRWLQAAENDGESMAILLGCGCDPRSQSIGDCIRICITMASVLLPVLWPMRTVPIPMPIGSFLCWMEREEPASTGSQPALSESASRPKSSTCAVPELVEKGLLAWHHFSLDASQAVCAYARHKQCTVNSRLLYTLHQSY